MPTRWERIHNACTESTIDVECFRLPFIPLRRPVSVNVFSRAAVPGQAKTRLIPALGAEGAASLLQRMIRVTLTQARKAGVGPVTLWCAPAPDDFLRALASDLSIEIRSQCGGDLGERMFHALRMELRRHAGAVLIGSDCPFVSAEEMRLAQRLLFEGDRRVVIGPSCDGGYYLIAARRVEAALFQGVHWGSSRVLGQTRELLRAFGWTWSELEAKHDIDRPRDLVHVPHLMDALPSA